MKPAVGKVKGLAGGGQVFSSLLTPHKLPVNACSEGVPDKLSECFLAGALP